MKITDQKSKPKQVLMRIIRLAEILVSDDYCPQNKSSGSNPNEETEDRTAQAKHNPSTFG